MLCYTEKVVREMMKSKSVGVDDVEGPPVPIPNTEVKLNSAEDTWRVTAWENRKMPTSKQPSNRAVVFLCQCGRFLHQRVLQSCYNC